MKAEIAELEADVSASPLYNKDLAPVPRSQRTWSAMHLAALWVGIAVCIPTYILASYMIRSGLSWQAALIIIGLANLIITIPMVLNGHAGVRYGIPFPVLGRAAFGVNGIHIASIIRAVVACGWFGVQTWIGGLAIYSIFNVLTGQKGSLDLDAGKFICFGIFWLLNIFFIWKGTESIKWLENFSAPILLLIGFVLIGWGAYNAGGFLTVLEQGPQLQIQAGVLQQDEAGQLRLLLTPLLNTSGNPKAQEYAVQVPLANGSYQAQAWQTIPADLEVALPEAIGLDKAGIAAGTRAVKVQYRRTEAGRITDSGLAEVKYAAGTADESSKFWTYLLWLTAMVGFWATMSLSISDITRYAASQRDQVVGQFLGLPGTMVLYSFVGIFVTCATVINFPDILIAQDAPWDPVSFLSRFDSPVVVVISQLAMLIATLSTNIAANVIAPANAFANLFPKKISFRTGGVMAGLIGILICPWWLMDEISSILIFISGLLGPVLGILLCDYYVIRKKKLHLTELYKPQGEYTYSRSGVNPAALAALLAGMAVALIGYWVPALSFLYKLSWFTGFAVAFAVYYFLYLRQAASQPKVNNPDPAVVAEPVAQV